MKFLKELLAPIYLGFALSAFGNLHWYDWRFYAIIVPFFIIAKATEFNKDEND